MLNTGVLKGAKAKLEGAVKQHGSVREKVQSESIALFEQRQRAAGEVITAVEEYVNTLANSPKDFDKSVAEYRLDVNHFDEAIHQLEVAAAEAKFVGSASGAAGAAAGVGVAAFGPTAALAIATTFGTASTGTAISTLSGAAAANAAMAWLGCGALAAGGGGMAGGQAMLALAGPVGWTIGGVALAGSAVYLHTRNARLAEEATQQWARIEAEKASLEIASRSIQGLREGTTRHVDGSLVGLSWLAEHAPRDYRSFADHQKMRLQQLINDINSLGALLRQEVAL
jgi:hypothetical protein